MTISYHRNRSLSNGGVSPRKSSAPISHWIKSVPVLSLPTGSHPPQALLLWQRAGLRPLDQTLPRPRTVVR
jgi:hypothetical protein